MARTADRPVPAGASRPRGALLRDRARRAVVPAPDHRREPPGAVLALSGFLGYTFVYTLWLKRRTVQNIVIGGAAGAVPPLVGWAAVTGEVTGTSIYLFAIVFFWTPPHFWALSLLMKDEYARVGVPMLPVVRGERETRRQILLYSVLLYGVTQLPFCAGGFGDGLPRLLGRARRAVHRRRGRALPPRRPSHRAAPVPLLARVPRRAVRGDGRRREALDSAAPHGSTLARKNIRSGLIAGAVCLFMFGMTFVAAVDLRLMSEPERGSVPPAGEEIHLPGPSLQPLLLTVGVTMLLIGVTTSADPGHRRRDPLARDAHRLDPRRPSRVRAPPLRAPPLAARRARARRRLRSRLRSGVGCSEGTFEPARSRIRECSCANWGSTKVVTIIYRYVRTTYQEQMPIQRPATIRHRTALFEDATAIVEAEYGADLSLDDIARRVASSRAPAPARVRRDRPHDVPRASHGGAHGARRRAAAQPRADRPRGRPSRRLPPARAVREGVPAPSRRRAVGVPLDASLPRADVPARSAAA